MIRVLIPSDLEFEIYKEELKTLYEKSQTQICDTNSFEFITQNTFFYAFLGGKCNGLVVPPTREPSFRTRSGICNAKNCSPALIGGIYYFVDEEGKLFLNGFANRKMHELNLECLKLSTSWFDCDIYAEAQNRMSSLCLLKCGFKRIGKSNVFMKEKI